MSQNNDMDQIPDGDVIESSAPSQKRKNGLPASLKFTAIVVVAIVGIGGTIFYSSKGQIEASQAPRARVLDSTPGGAVQQESAVYQESVRELNEKRTELAGQMGATSVPTPEVIMNKVEPITDIAVIDTTPPEVEKKPEAAPEPVKKPVAERRSLPQPVQPASRPEPARVAVAETSTAPATASNDGGKAKENPYATRINSQMRSTANAFAPKGMTQGRAEASSETASETGTQAAADTASGTGNVISADQLMLRPGDILYAETMSSVNSDMNAPVLAEVVSGEFKGARLTGSFTADKVAERMVVAFTNMTLVDGTVVSLNAYAVDGASAETAVASDVERRYVARYGPIIAAAFVTGYGRSAAQREETVIGTGDNATVATGAATARQSLYAGLSDAADAVAADVMANVPKGPKVILRDGYPIGIMIIEPVQKN